MIIYKPKSPNFQLAEEKRKESREDAKAQSFGFKFFLLPLRSFTNLLFEALREILIREHLRSFDDSLLYFTFPV
jgi:hypothetical protein